MTTSVSQIVLLSLVSVAVSLKATTYLSTGSSTPDDIQDTTSNSSTIAHSTLVDTNGNFENKANNVIASSQNVTTEKELDGEFGGSFKWDKVDAFLKSQTRGVLENLNFEDAIRRGNASDACKTDLQLYLNSLLNLEPWSVKMADANGWLAGGVLEGRFRSLGSYEECLKVRVSSEENMDAFRGQYCLSIFRSPLLSKIYLKNGSLNQQYMETYGEPPRWIQEFIHRMGPYLKQLQFSVGTCVPSTCSDQDLAQIITHIVSPFEVSVEVMGCQVQKPITWSKSLIAAVSVLSGIALLCILGSAMDLINRASANRASEEKKSNNTKHTTIPMTVLQMFSVPSNVEILVKEDKGSFQCLGGIRFFSVAWITLFHTYYIQPTWLFHRFHNALAFKEDFSGSLLLAPFDNISIPNVSFFFMSGFLMSYLMWKKMKKGNGKVNFVKYFLHKYWRLTPCIALILAVFIVVVRTGSGPLWNSTLDRPLEMCHRNWWRTFLYMANWWEMGDMCLVHTWFVACLIQLQVIGFIIIHITFRWPKVGVFMGVIIVLGCCALVVTLAVLKNLPLPNTNAQKDLDVLFVCRSLFRYKPFYYLPAFAIGMVLGYLILKYKDQKIKQRYQALGWILSLIRSTYAVFGIQGPADNIVFTAFYYAFSFMAWSASLGWFIYACIAGYAGILNSFLSWRGFQVLGNLSYLIYLFHYIVIYYHTASLRELVHYGHYEMMSTTLSILAISTLLAFIGHVTVEIPFNHLEKVICRYVESIGQSSKKIK